MVASDYNAKKFAKYTTKRIGSERAVAEAYVHILKKFFKVKYPYIINDKTKVSGGW